MTPRDTPNDEKGGILQAEAPGLLFVASGDRFIRQGPGA